MTIRNELKDLLLEGIALLVTAIVVIILLVYTDLGKWSVILLGAGVGMGVILLFMGGRKKKSVRTSQRQRRQIDKSQF